MGFYVPPSPSPQPGRLPTFVVIGAQKAGTTALHHYLGQHPQIHVSREKELHFFLDPGILPPDPRGFERGAWQQGLDWYRAWFQTDRPVCGEFSPNYTGGPWTAVVAQRMAAHIPQVKLIYLVRNPIERLRSSYLMALKRTRNSVTSVTEWLDSFSGVSQSYYGSNLRCFLEHFPREQILVLESSRMDHSRREALGEVFRFLGVDDQFWSPEFERRIFEGSRRPLVSSRGSQVRDSAAMRFLRTRLSTGLFFHVENLVLAPFRIPDPPLVLSPSEGAALAAKLRSEMELLRSLTGQAFPSLRVDLNQLTIAPS
jgi:hypothetical protein